MNKTFTIHGVLAGAYDGFARGHGLTGKNENRPLLNHASVDRVETSLCGKIKDYHLCDQHESVVTCPACLRKIAKLGLQPATDDIHERETLIP